jgi:hypothetical protein
MRGMGKERMGKGAEAGGGMKDDGSKGRVTEERGGRTNQPCYSISAPGFAESGDEKGAGCLKLRFNSSRFSATPSPLVTNCHDKSNVHH